MNKVNQNEAPEGYVAVDGANLGCPSCEYNCGTDEPCLAERRKDGCDVIFKRPGGMTFEEALKLLREGKEVRWKAWERYDIVRFRTGTLELIHREGKYFCENYPLDIEDLNATDWMEYTGDSK